MPELPEVENVALALRECLVGRRLTGMAVRFGGVLEPGAAAFAEAVVGRVLVGVRRQGKYLLMIFGDSAGCREEVAGCRGVGRQDVLDHSATIERGSRRAVRLHLRMTGQFFVDPGFTPDAHTHLVLDFDGLPVYYRDIRKFGRLALVEADADGAFAVAPPHVGPDMLEIGFAAWRARLAGRRAPIKAVLLDQGVAAGIGNIYADEALFRARVHPLTPADALADGELRRIFAAARAVMRLAIRHGGTTYLNFVDFRGRPGNFRRRLRVYQRDGEPCRDCGATLARLVVAGRASHFCPRCQPAPRKRRARRPSATRPRASRAGS
ncbi:MAG: bifunctional DNA-formamidopyrimidine glycosylase/DNA-(apurinic or apyrimidinic site) lyase [Candidatus Krumholzibacteriia bacterium]